MKTHEIAKVLSSLAQVLRKGPDVELSQLLQVDRPLSRPNPSTIPMALSALTALSQFNKNQWQAIIKEYGFPIEVRVTESTRDVVGKILRHLEQDPEARRKLKQAVQRSKSDVSPELINALTFLLK
ncbi:MAG: hypothetical protein L6R19_17335 [Alphaproteobacteria bacterium]|nr:hypothetical protein [Alphaproteobacteria bacterium]